MSWHECSIQFSNTRLPIRLTDMTTSHLLLSKIIDFTIARNRSQLPPVESDVVEHHEQRRELRRRSNDRLFLQIVQSEDQDLVGTTISSNTLDASANGLKVASDQYIPVGCIIDLWVDDRVKPGKFFLSSEVRWISEDQSGSFALGVELLESAATDVQKWRERQG